MNSWCGDQESMFYQQLGVPNSSLYLSFPNALFLVCGEIQDTTSHLVITYPYCPLAFWQFFHLYVFSWPLRSTSEVFCRRSFDLFCLVFFSYLNWSYGFEVKIPCKWSALTISGGIGFPWHHWCLTLTTWFRVSTQVTLLFSLFPFLFWSIWNIVTKSNLHWRREERIKLHFFAWVRSV